MKRLIIPGLALLALLALFQWGNSILEQTLDAELPKLLARELGIPVTLAPTRTRIATLTVHSPKLVMGEPANPALVATGVMVSLNWSDLLRGEIRLRRASGDKLMVTPSLWPGNDDPWPDDYRFLDPYLPDKLQLESASYVDADGNPLNFAQPQWLRQSAGATVSWQQELQRQAVAVRAGLSSLDDLLRLARIKLQITTAPTDRKDSIVDVSLEIEPGEHSGYSLNAHIEAAGMTGSVTAANPRAWAWPDQSSTDIKQLDVKKLQVLLSGYGSDTTDASPGTVLALPLPRLALPDHKGKVTIDEIRWRHEALTNTAFDFTTGADGVDIPALSSHGPSGVLQGNLGVISTDTGWQLALSAKLEAAGTDGSLANAYLNADWFWREGNSRITGQGATWDSLLKSLHGDITVSGSHHGASVTPVAITARLDNRPAQFALDMIELKLANGRITGSMSLSGDDRKRLTGKISVEQLDLDFLLPPGDPNAAPGIEIPTYLTTLPELDLDWQLDIAGLKARGFKFERAGVTFLRTEEKATLNASARGQNKSLLELHLDANTASDKPATVTMRADLSHFEVSQLFQQATIFPDSRTSGVINFSSRGSGMEQVFRAMRGTANLTVDRRPDQDRERPPRPDEQLQASGEASFIIADDRITGLQLNKIAIDSTRQNLTGRVSVADGRTPWLEANLTSDKLDLAHFQSKNAADAPESDPIKSLRELGESELTLVARSLRAADLALSNVKLRLSTARDKIAIKQLDFSLGQGRVTSEGGMTWHKDDATLSLDAAVDNFSLDKFLADAPSAASVPLSGTVSLHSTGATFSSLLADLTGDIRLTASAGSGSAAGDTPARVDMTARQTADGMHAVIHRFLWEGTDLAGSLRYRGSTPPLLEVEIAGGSLSLLPWGPAEEDTKKDTENNAGGSSMMNTARSSAGLIGQVAMAPLRLISGPREAKPGDKLFSNTPLPFDWLSKYEASVKGKLDKLISREGNASDLNISIELLGGKLNLEATAGSLNGGSAEASVLMNVLEQPTSVALKGTFRNMRGDLVKGGFARSGHFDFNSRGQSQAELAANVSGLVYVELGAGTLDYGNLMLLTADVATHVFETLIPGADKAQPQLECAVTLGVFKDGIGNTPYGYAARTNLANLVGRVDLNLKNELLHLNFSSSSRKGLGLSVGNVFSNTVEIEGPLTNPKIVPNTTGLLWRGWTAVMTGGLSVVGESVLKRTLASKDPCKSVQKNIRDDFCGSNAAAAASPMVCPPA